MSITKSSWVREFLPAAMVASSVLVAASIDVGFRGNSENPTAEIGVDTGSEGYNRLADEASEIRMSQAKWVSELQKQINQLKKQAEATNAN